ncbi:ATP-binding protein [Spirosoma foliorum]|uniref:histidine kinase n=1 Tax=Spirosoma foliorum TaxID=2710596 RepID=A0A7G5GQ28_9BACT|nr:ATP-binding protein [Spirosoma foliorum]QMW00970.1 PAS domain-containing protein [Spirosoma foliorum]
MQEIAMLIPGGLITLNTENEIIYLNPFADQLLGYGPGALVGKQMDVVLTRASRIYFQTHLYPLIALGKLANELYLTLQTQSGVRIPVLLNAIRHEDALGVGFTYLCLMPVYQRRQYEQELLASKQAAEQALLRTDELMALQQLEQHQAEMDRQVTNLKQRNDELEQFGRIIAHDLQEPLRKINLLASALNQEDTNRLSSLGQRGLKGIVRASTRLRQLIHDLQIYFTFEPSRSTDESVDLTELMEQAVATYSSTGIRFEIASLPTIVGNRAELLSLFGHLLDNAVKFRQLGRSSVVAISGSVVSQNRYQTTPDKYQYIEYARILVSDNGIGFNNQYREEVFGILKKLDPHTPGIGLGLSLAKKIVERHHGIIRADSREGQGTTITLLFPLIS